MERDLPLKKHSSTLRFNTSMKNSPSGFQLCHKSVSQSQRTDNPVNQSKLEMHAADAKRGKTPKGESRLVWSLLIG